MQFAAYVVLECSGVIIAWCSKHGARSQYGDAWMEWVIQCNALNIMYDRVTRKRERGERGQGKEGERKRAKDSDSDRERERDSDSDRDRDRVHSPL